MNLRNVFLYVSLVLAAAACGAHNQGQPIDGGDGIVHGANLKANNPLAKSVVALVSKNDEGEALCTGTILNDQTILTAAHCVEDNPVQIFVVFGPKIKSVKKDHLRAVDNFMQEPRWKSSHGAFGDLAIIHFNGGLPKGYEPVVLADKSLKLSADQQVVMVGYGVSNATEQSGSGTLRETKTTVIGNANHDQIATDGRISSVCFGDSGGPAFVEQNGQMVQWGVAHSVINRQCDQTSVHTSVMNNLNWIESEMKKLSK